MEERRRNIGMGLFTIAFALLNYFYFIPNHVMPTRRGYGVEGMRAYPTMVNWILLGVGIILLMRNTIPYLLERKQAAYNSASTEKEIGRWNLSFLKNEDFLKTIFIIIISFIYVFYLEKIGYIIASPIYLIILMRYLGLKNWKKNLTITAAITFAVYFMFIYLLRTILPLGILTPFF